MMKTTKNENLVIMAIVMDQFQDGAKPEKCKEVWTWSVSRTFAVQYNITNSLGRGSKDSQTRRIFSGVVSSLVKKGLVVSQIDDKYRTLRLTEEGAKVYKGVKPKSVEPLSQPSPSHGEDGDLVGKAPIPPKVNLPPRTEEAKACAANMQVYPQKATKFRPLSIVPKVDVPTVVAQTHTARFHEEWEALQKILSGVLRHAYGSRPEDYVDACMYAKKQLDEMIKLGQQNASRVVIRIWPDKVEFSGPSGLHSINRGSENNEEWQWRNRYISHRAEFLKSNPAGVEVEERFMV